MLSPQLPLEGAILAAGGFPGIGKLAAEELLYLQLRRRGRRPGAARSSTMPALTAKAVAQLAARIAWFDDPATPYRSRVRPFSVEADVEPFRSILLGLFFLAVGMLLDLHAIAERPFFVIGMAIALIAVKAAVIMGLAMAFKMAWRPALGLGLLLSQGGEFGFVLFAQAQNALLIAPEAASLFGAIVTLSMATTPFLMMATRRLRAQPVAKEEREGPVADGSNAMIVGYGRFGQTVAQMLVAQGIAVTLIDTDIEMIDVAGSFGAKVYYGDGTRVDMLRQAGGAEAELILFCIDGDQIGPELIEAVHEAFPGAAVFVRAFDRRAFLKLKGAPVAGVVREVLDSAVRMARMAMESVGVDLEEIDRTEDLYRARDRERLKAQIESGDLRAQIDRIITTPERVPGRSRASAESRLDQLRHPSEGWGPYGVSMDPSLRWGDGSMCRKRLEERLADAARQDQAALLVVRHPRREPLRIDIGRGRQADRLQMRIARSASAAGQRLRSTDSRKAIAMPIATASPWRILVSASMAWPKLWPKLSKARRPFGVALVAGDECGLGAHAGLDRMEPRRAVAGEQGRAIRLAPGEEGRDRRSGRI